jgi:hypothetical protein
MALKVLGHHKLQDPLHLAIQVQVRRSLYCRLGLRKNPPFPANVTPKARLERFGG